MPEVDGPDARNPFSGPRADLGRRAEATDTIIIGVAVIAGLYFGREVLVPVSIAILLSFVLAPVTTFSAAFASAGSLPHSSWWRWRSRS
jgi:hypothetical protein